MSRSAWTYSKARLSVAVANRSLAMTRAFLSLFQISLAKAEGSFAALGLNADDYRD